MMHDQQNIQSIPSPETTETEFDVDDYLELYSSARKKDKGWILDEVMILTGWSRDHARRRLAAFRVGEDDAYDDPPADQPSSRCCKYSPESRALLVRIWEWSGFQSGKYLAAVMPQLLDAAERHGALVPDRDGYSLEVRAELLAVSPASIDRYLRTARAEDFRDRRVSTKRFTSPSEDFLDFASGPNEYEPGFFLVDTIAHAGPTEPRTASSRSAPPACTPVGSSPAVLPTMVRTLWWTCCNGHSMRCRDSLLGQCDRAEQCR
jgi:hypothetical protein